MYRRFFLICAIFLLTECAAVPHVSSETLELQKQAAQAAVVMITDSTGLRGGTGFHMLMPSGQVAIVTNSHICRLGDKDGNLYVIDDAAKRAIKRRILEDSDTTDLCLVEGLPGRKGLKIADKEPKRGDIIRVEGHPHLIPTIESQGLYVERQLAEVIVGRISGPEDLDACSKPKNKIGTIDGLFGQTDVCLEVIPSFLITAPTFGGNSGSPVIDNTGNVVGVVFAGQRDTNWGCAVILEDLRAFISAY